MTRQASSNSLDRIVRDLRPYLSNIVISFDEDKDDEDKDKDAEDDESGEGASGTGTGSSDGSSKDDIKDPEKKRLSDEAAAHRVKAKTEKERADNAEAELRKLTDKDKSELEKAQRDLTEAVKRAEKAEAQVAEMALKIAFIDSGAHSLFRDPKDAPKLLDFSDMEMDADGKYDLKAMKAKAEALVKEKPYLSSTEGTDGSGSSTEGGSPNNGRKVKTPDNAALTKKFPALASRS